MNCFRCVARQEEKEVTIEEPTVSKSVSELPPDDSRISLTGRQKYILLKNWKGISRQAALAGATMFVKMFEDDTNLYDLFEFANLRKSSKEEQLDTLQNHGGLVMNVFDEAVQNISNGDAFFRVLEHYGKMHAHKRGFKADFFQKMEEPFLYSIKMTMGDRYTDNMDKIYKKIIRLILETMERNCREEMVRIGVELEPNDVQVHVDTV